MQMTLEKVIFITIWPTYKYKMNTHYLLDFFVLDMIENSKYIFSEKKDWEQKRNGVY